MKLKVTSILGMVVFPATVVAVALSFGVLTHFEEIIVNGMRKSQINYFMCTYLMVLEPFV